MYSIYCKLRDKKGVSDYHVAKSTGINSSTFSDWKSGRSSPKRDKLQKIADYFGVSLEYLMTGKEPEHDADGKKYYFNAETAQMAQELFDDPDLHVLFDAARNSRPEDLRLAAEMLKRLKEMNTDG